jgi:penicillin-binding protein-related factor A (putative recombinase)
MSFRHFNRQRPLPALRHRTSQSNRGKDWEEVLSRTHDWYRSGGFGYMRQNPGVWNYCGQTAYKNSPPVVTAMTGDGRPLIRMKSAPDFTGQILGVPVEFDAKEFAEASIAIQKVAGEKLDGHVVEYLAEQQASCRGRGHFGFMVLEKRHSRVWWVTAGYVAEWLEGVRRRPEETAKSLNFSKVEDDRIKLLGECDGFRFDYAPLLIPDFESLKGD